MHILKTLQIILKKFIKNYSGKTDTILNTASNSFEMFKKVEYLQFAMQSRLSFLEKLDRRQLV